MEEVIRQDYIRTARAKGLDERVVIHKHAFRNTLIPFVTLLGRYPESEVLRQARISEIKLI